MTEAIVTWTEQLCDYFDEMSIELFTSSYRQVSKSATIAAIRVHYYVDNICPRHNRVYKSIYFLLNDPRSNWNNLNINEKRGLLDHINFQQILVYHQRHHLIEEIS